MPAGPAGLAVYLLTVVLAWTVGQWRGAQQARIRAETRRAVVEERARIAREVHDVVAHTLSVMVIQAGAADDVHPATRTGPSGTARHRDIRPLRTRRMRVLLRAFRPDTEENRTEENGTGEEGTGERREPGPWLARLEELAEAVRATGMAVDIHREGTIGSLPAAVDLAAYRIVQEVLTSTLRHAAGADGTGVRITAEAQRLRITVTDNGLTPQYGSVHSGPAAAGAGCGLAGMKERARLVGGSLHAAPLPAGGFEVAAQLPVEEVS
ncbi:signal transduction histidine kinase [Streptomyces rapamycinicus]|uniref:histidine kinase n=2 Tax=Streptomyces rapamycinicus TaxID=1226757 RepID=A0A3L8R991_STRRN|nr:ATP-binding protein [Streptomyces rapamycinicus]MBB4779060.1 signal transduction histidine kinase [Streptomyces rapamycinicus]MBB4787252.1 signal transduction histidine kinase [Streptomyces rapamycinicus]RLV71603.1 two-component sensor histidine kinase [Streptomyces rapamycinicus NRRL 5491]RLV76266.1 two-component sensor histidine kinase [Streptomyces rapamycinicus NRRL 5491]